MGRLARQLLILVVLLAGLGGLLAINNANRQHNQPASEDLAINAADWFARDVSVTAYDDSGKLERQLQATKLLHYSKDKTTHIKNPHFTLTKAQQPPWTSSAQSGIAYHRPGSEQIVRLELQGQAKLMRTGLLQYEHAPELMITTDTLTLYPDDARAETSSTVAIKQPGHQISATGMHASLKNETISLTHKVRGRHRLPGNSTEDATIAANKLHYDHKLGHAVYRGNVAGLQGARKLKAERLELFRNPEHKIDQVKAFGSPATFSTTTDLGQITGSAQQIHLHQPTNDIMLLDDAELARGEESYRAPKIEYNLDSEVIRSPEVEGGRTRITIGKNTLSGPH